MYVVDMVRNGWGRLWRLSLEKKYLFFTMVIDSFGMYFFVRLF